MKCISDEEKTESATAIRTAKKRQQLDAVPSSAMKDASGMESCNPLQPCVCVYTCIHIYVHTYIHTYIRIINFPPYV